jgi:hypothetical protein
MADYNYVRGTLASGLYDINNPERVDGSGNQIWLANEVETAIPGKQFTLYCDSTNATFTFAETLSAGDETTLTTTVNNHKNNT